MIGTSNVHGFFVGMLWIFMGIQIWGLPLRAGETNGLQYTSVTTSGTGMAIFGYKCSTNKTLQIPASIEGRPVVRIFGPATRYACNTLTNIIIPSSVTDIDVSSFFNLPNLIGITVDPANSSYSSQGGVLFNKTKTELLLCPSRLQGAITIPNSVTTIAAAAFNDCSGLSSISIPNSVTKIESGAFRGCSSLSSIVIPESVTSVGLGAFQGCRGLTSFSIHYSVTTIEDYSFQEWRRLTRLTIPNTVTRIGDSAFAGCGSLTNIIIGNRVSSIGWWAFSYCTNLTSITIPGSVTNIGDLSFYGCNKLTNICFRGNAPTGNSGLSIMDGVARKSLSTVYYMPGSTGWSNFKVSSNTKILPYPPGLVFGADAAARIANGILVGLDILDGGYGYQVAPTITLLGGGGSGAAATATIDGNGVLSGIKITNPGHGYTRAPTVVINPPTKPATATASVVNGFVVGLTITEGGQGYSTPPDIQLIGGGGSGATATATLNSNGTLIAINIVNVGRGYTNAPTVRIAPPVVPLPVVSANVVQTLLFSGLNDAVNYDFQKSTTGNLFQSTGVSISPKNGIFSTTSDLFAQGSSSGYFNESVSYRLVAKPLPSTATARVQVVNGFLVGLTIIDGGRGYTTPPTVTITDSTGSGAMVTAIMNNDWVKGFSVVNPGSRYSSSAKVIVSPPTVLGIAPTASPTLRLGVTNLLTNFNYQLQTSTSLPLFSNTSSAFIATNQWQNFYIPMESTQGFHRIKFAQ